MTLRFWAEIRVDATCDAVWAVFADLPGWSGWNTVSPVTPAALEVGARWTLALHARGAERRARVRVVTCEAGRALAWRGGVPWVLDVVHGFTLRPDGDGCVITHHETFVGLLAPLVPRVLGPRHGDMYGAVNARLVEVVVSRRS
jgi:hypothetical protein